MKYFILLTALLMACVASQQLSIEQSIIETYENGPVKELFKVFHFVYKRPYDLNSETAVKKYRVFKENVKQIKEHNAKNLSWTQGVNQFTDMTDDEFLALNTVKPPKNLEIDNMKNSFSTQKFLFELEDDDSSDFPTPRDNSNPSQYANINWLQYMPAIKDQKSCGCCYAFSTAYLIESWANIRSTNGFVPATSTQQIIDCSANWQNLGCHGGWQTWSLTYFSAVGGVMNDSDYPFVNTNASTCKFNINKVGPVKIVGTKGYKSCDPGYFGGKPCTLASWYAMLAQGPVAVVVDTVGTGLSKYKKGVIDVSNIACGVLNHAVTVYKWNTTALGTELTVRNNWGVWGENGDFRIYYSGTNNMSTCWITQIGIIPTFN